MSPNPPCDFGTLPLKPVRLHKGWLGEFALRLHRQGWWIGADTPLAVAEACKKADEALLSKGGLFAVRVAGETGSLVLVDLEAAEGVGESGATFWWRMLQAEARAGQPDDKPALDQPAAPPRSGRLRIHVLPAGVPAEQDAVRETWRWLGWIWQPREGQTAGEAATSGAPPNRRKLASLDASEEVESGTRELLAYIQDRILSIAQADLPPYNIFTQGPFDFHLEPLVALARGREAAVQALARRGEFGVPNQYDRAGEVGMLLVKVLARIDEDGARLASLAEDPGAPWYVRRDAAKHLGSHRRSLPGMLTVLFQPSTGEEVRASTLEVLAAQGVPGTLPAIHWMLENQEAKPGSRWIDPALAHLALGVLGDPFVLRDLLEGVEDPFWFSRGCAEKGLAALLGKIGGVGRALSLLQDIPALPGLADQISWVLDREAGSARRWLLDELWKTGAVEQATMASLRCLGDAHWPVNRLASERICAADSPPLGRLLQVAGDPAATRSARLWAGYCLARLGHATGETLADLAEVEVPVHPPLDPALRAAIVTKWAADSQPGTDVRWLIEGARTPSPSVEDRAHWLSRLLGALEKEGLNAGEPDDFLIDPMPASCTFAEICIEGIPYRVSRLGPVIAPKERSESATRETLIRQVCLGAGWIWPEAAVLNQVIPGLRVYFFGDRRELRVEDLVFYWQD